VRLLRSFLADPPLRNQQNLEAEQSPQSSRSAQLIKLRKGRSTGLDGVRPVWGMSSMAREGHSSRRPPSLTVSSDSWQSGYKCKNALAIPEPAT
jgi:hypothetical protein